MAHLFEDNAVATYLLLPLEVSGEWGSVRAGADPFAALAPPDDLCAAQWERAQAKQRLHRTSRNRGERADVSMHETQGCMEATRWVR